VVAEAGNLNTGLGASLEDRVRTVDLHGFAINEDVELVVEGLGRAEESGSLVNWRKLVAGLLDGLRKHYVVYGFELFSEC